MTSVAVYLNTEVNTHRPKDATFYLNITASNFCCASFPLHMKLDPPPPPPKKIQCKKGAVVKRTDFVALVISKICCAVDLDLKMLMNDNEIQKITIATTPKTLICCF